MRCRSRRGSKLPQHHRIWQHTGDMEGYVPCSWDMPEDPDLAWSCRYTFHFSRETLTIPSFQNAAFTIQDIMSSWVWRVIGSEPVWIQYATSHCCWNGMHYKECKCSGRAVSCSRSPWEIYGHPGSFDLEATEGMGGGRCSLCTGRISQRR